MKMAKKKAASKVETVEEMLFLRTCAPGGISHNGFLWPLEVGAVVTAPDWDPAPKCGGGLHGLKDGNGNAGLMNWSLDAIWIVFSSPFGVDLDGKWKVQTATIRAVGDRKSVTDFLIAAKRTGVHGGTSMSGYCGTSTSGYCGTSMSGYCGTSTSGDGGTSMSGDGGTSTSGDRGTSMSGDGGSLIIYWWDGNCRRFKVGYIGEDGLKPNTKYRLNDAHKFEEVKG
jgi:hypothetical protein